MNFDYEHVSSYMVYTTSGHKLILIESKNQRLKVEEGDVIAIRFPSTGPAAALKTSLTSFSFLYNNSVINGTKVLRSNRLPSTAESPTELRYVPAIAILYSAVSETKFESRYQEAGHETVSFSVGNSRGRVIFTREIALQEAITGFEVNLPDAFPSAESVNVTVDIADGTNVSYIWQFGDGENATTLTPWVTHVYKTTGVVTVYVLAINKVSLISIWCTTVIQERIDGMEFRDTALLPIENGTTANIGWLLRNGSHVDFNITVTSAEGDNRATNLTNAKVPRAIFFAIYKTNLTIPGLYLVTITATNKVNSLTINGNLSVQRQVHGVYMTHPGVVKTNQTFNFTVLPHQGEEAARYALLAMDGTIINTTQKVIPHVYTKAGRYKVALIASNDISSVVARCAEVIVQDVIEGLEFKSFRRDVGVMEETRVHWKVNQGSELSILVDYGDGATKLFNKSISVGDIFVAISLHNYTAPGDYLVNITVRNLVDSQWINITIHVETPVEYPGLVLERGLLQRAEGGSCSKDLYISVNDSVTATADITNGTNVNMELDFGEGSVRSMYYHRDFPANGTTEKYLYSTEGTYNITVKFFNRNQQNRTHTCRVIVQYPISAVLLTSNSPQPSSPGDVELSFSFPGYNASGPLDITHNFGDNTSKNIQDDKRTVHRYPRQGAYTATVNVCNEISCGNASVEVRIQDIIHGLEFSPLLTSFIADECPDKNFSPKPDMFPIEYDVFFNSSITNGTNVTYTWRFSRDGVELKGISCRRNFSSTGEHTVELTAQNDISNMTKTMEITVQESIVGVKLKNDGPAEMKKPLNFSLSMEKKGTHSCFTIDLKDKEEFRNYTTGDNPECHDTKKTFETVENFTYTYENPKYYDVTFQGKNNVSCVGRQTKAAIVKGECIFPIITAPGFGKTIAKFKRSEKINVKTVNTIKCYNYSTQYWWNISKLDASQLTDLTGNVREQIKTDRSDLIIVPRTLEYGNYKLQFMIRMVAEPGVSTIETFDIRITPSPLVATIDGGTERTVGNEDPLELNAGKSYDPDTTESGTSLDVVNCKCQFAWFCKQDDEPINKAYELPTDLTNLPPMPTPPPTTNTTGNHSSEFRPLLGGCFGYGPGQLNFSSTSIMLNTTKMTANTTYIIRFVLKKDTRSVYTDQKVRVLPGNPPTLSIE